MTEKIFKVAAPQMASVVQWGAKYANKDRLVVLELDEGQLTVSGSSGTNLSRARCDVNQQFSGKERISVSSELLSNALSLFKSTEATFTIERTESGTGKMTAKNARSSVVMPFTGEGTRAKLPDTPPLLGSVMTDEFKKAVTEVGEAAAPKGTSPVVLTGIHLSFNVEQSTMVMTSTDRYRLVQREVPLELAPGVNSQALADHSLNLSADGLRMLLKDVSNDGMLKIYNAPMVDNAQESSSLFGISSSFQIGLTGVMGGEYLRYKPLLQLQLPHVITFTTADLLMGLQDAKKILSGADKRVLLTVDGGNVALSAHTDTTNFDMDVDFVSTNVTEEVQLDFNVDFLYAAVKTCREDKVALRFMEPKRPAEIREIREDGSEHGERRNIVMTLAPEPKRSE